MDPRAVGGVAGAGLRLAAGSSGIDLAVLLDMTLDDLGGFFSGVVSVLLRATHQFFRQFGRKLVDENSFLAGVRTTGHFHGA